MKLHRRQFLRAAGVSLALPCFDAFSPARAADAEKPKRRMVCICTPLGLHPENFIPEETGKDYTLSPYLETLEEFRDDFTVISGLTHAGVSPGFAHQATASFLTGASGAGRPGFRNGISLDQFAAEYIGSQTRFPTLILSGEGLGLSWSRTGAQIPADNSPSRVFAKMFLAGRADEVEAQVRRLQDNRSILDDVRDQANALRPTSAPTIVTSSTSTSPASESWNNDWSRTKPGASDPSPRLTPNRPKTFPIKPTSLAERVCYSTSRIWRCRPIRPGSSRSCWPVRPTLRQFEACPWAITTCPTTARILGSSHS
jgi:hypothetical protein